MMRKLFKKPEIMLCDQSKAQNSSFEIQEGKFIDDSNLEEFKMKIIYLKHIFTYFFNNKYIDKCILENSIRKVMCIDLFSIIHSGLIMEKVIDKNKNFFEKNKNIHFFIICSILLVHKYRTENSANIDSIIKKLGIDESYIFITEKYILSKLNCILSVDEANIMIEYNYLKKIIILY